MRQSELNFQMPDLGDRVLTNVDHRKTGHILLQDICNSTSVLLVTGFSSLQYLLDKLLQPWSGDGKMRILFGSEELGEYRENAVPQREQSFDKLIADYWTSAGISLQTAPAILHAIELVKAGTVEIRLLSRLHAKLYCCDGAVYIGSSNLSRSGLHYQYEANIRLSSDEADGVMVRDVAEAYWEMGNPASQWFLGLLEQLLQVVSWREALARSISEVVYSSWMKDYPRLLDRVSRMRLWPSQRSAIGQALYILDNCGSLLVADPTGAGKSRLGVALQILLEARLTRERGEYETPKSVIVCPPVVQRNWVAEYFSLEVGSPNILSQGRLQTDLTSKKRDDIQTRKSLSGADILFVDEAHNYLNRKSNRSRQLETAMPDLTLLFTATPINKSLSDVFRLVELLDIDSFPDALIEQIQELEKADRTGRQLTRSDVAPILQRFTIRRTKDDLNAMINQEPEAYVDDQGRKCRYPIHRAQVYTLDESESDVEIARQIILLADKLIGLSRLKQLFPYPNEVMLGLTPEKIVEKRMKTAAALAKYQVLERMRSSAAALLEHVLGTDAAAKRYNLDYRVHDKENGDMHAGALRLAERLPAIDPSLPAPNFLTDLGEYLKACKREAELYKRIGELAAQLDDTREIRKADLLVELSARHGRVIAFDSHLITLEVIRIRIKDRVKYRMVTGSTGDPEALQEEFGPFSEDRPIVGLCSDSMTEGVNLQGASAVVLLSMPSVMRIAEQRIGRIDRLNSPHEEIQVYWPQDHPVFALDTDLKFYRTASDVSELLGGNIDIPLSLTDRLGSLSVKRGKGIGDQSPSTARAEFDAAVSDSFEIIHELYDGSEALIDRTLVEQYRNVGAPVLSCVSVVHTPSSFSFFCLRGSDDRAPSWVFIGQDDRPLTDLVEVVPALREHLSEAIDMDPDEADWAMAIEQAIFKLEARCRLAH
jgi:superfamily II DNA or RNA helicase